MVTNSRTPIRVDRLRALNVPRRVIVVEVDGEVREVREAGEIARRVAAVGEIWRVDDEWWRVPIARRYVEVILEGGRHVMLYEDLTTHEWFLQDI